MVVSGCGQERKRDFRAETRLADEVMVEMGRAEVRMAV